ncbi:MAG: acetylglutamate kinase [Cytophagales bacterium]|nr:acetylglutamate kinase [Cytophagales bacterium]
MAISIIKIGGNVIDNEKKLEKFLQLFSSLKGDKILVHGGGKIATQIAADLGVETQMVEGRRITDAPMREVVTMVYGGKVNKTIVASLQSLGTNAIGLSGADGGVILAEKRPVKDIDYGYVGDVKQVNGSFIQSLLLQKVTPVFAPLSFDPEYGILNTNADTQASAIAVEMAKIRDVNLVYCFEKKGVLKDADDEESVIAKLDRASYENYKKEGIIHSGMIPKLDNAFEAVKAGVRKVIICEADDLLNAVENSSRGTTIRL